MRTIAANLLFALAMVSAASAADLQLTEIRECAPLVKNATPIRLECPLINGKIDERYCVCPEDVPPVLVSAQ
jgi:hypothetical protein